MISKERLIERLNNYRKILKKNWDLFKESKIGLVGLGILVFFAIIALVSPYIGLRDPINWRAPEKDLIELREYWERDTHNPLFKAGYPINYSTTYRIVPQQTGPRADRLYVPSGNKLIALRPSTSEIVWRAGGIQECCFVATSNITTSPLVVNFGSNVQWREEDFIVVFGTEDGTLYFLKEERRTSFTDFTSPLPQGENVVAVHLDGMVTSVAAFTDGLSGRALKERVFAGTANGTLYAFSGEWKDDETWYYNVDTEQWQRLYPSIRPTQRDQFAMVYSPRSNVVLLFGGYSGSERGDTWIFNVTTGNWTEEFPEKAPSPRYGHSIVYYPEGNQALLFGGYGERTFHNDTWIFNFKNRTWEEVKVVHSPSPRSGQSMVYDSDNHEAVLFGGSERLANNETWVYNFSAQSWTQETYRVNNTIIGAPPPRIGHSMVYDEKNHDVMLFGGKVLADIDTFGNPVWRNDNTTWVYDASSNNWTRVDPSSNPPSSRAFHTLLYLNSTGEVLLFGGIGDSRSNETWLYNVTTREWTELTPTGSPSKRDSHQMVMIGPDMAMLYGGDDFMPSELWNRTSGRKPIRMASVPMNPTAYPEFSPAVDQDGDELFVNNGNLLAVWTENGENVWQENESNFVLPDGSIPVDPDWTTPPIVSINELIGGYFGGIVYVATSNGYLHAFLATNGAVLPSWEELPYVNDINGIRGVPLRKTLAKLDEGVLTTPASDRGTIYVGSSTGYLYAVKRDKAGGLEAGRIKWRYHDEALLRTGRLTFATKPLPKPAIGMIFISGNYDSGTVGDIADDVGYAYCLRENGNLSWKIEVNGTIHGNIHVWMDEQTSGHLKESVLFGTSKGIVYSFSSTGQYLAPLPPTWLSPVPSGNTYWLGTDSQGRDLFSQWMWGSRIAFTVGLLAAFFSILIGTIIGLVAGYSSGKVDSVLMRFTDVVLVLPGLPLIIILAAVLGAGIWNIILVLAVVGWPGTARVIRSEVLSLKERPFIDSARVTGASNIRIMFKHIAPNVLPLAFLYMTFAVSGAILTEAALSFIGLGDISTPSWGQMLMYLQQSNVLTSWWWLLPPGLGITFLSLAFYLIGRGYEQIINPRLRKR